ncbi:MAG: GNAT family N-acetyltransferase [Stenomitos rutilans HA7619-LM2]|jgi:ribosomal protein S18 acetylase RimI-like enzyme|nr:GNAT family N-acetyltransferase [Stenomitos rutilans HA7619-LM2]
MAVIIRDALAQEVDDVALLTVEAYREYSHALTLDNWEIMRSSLSNMAEIAKQGQLIVAKQDQELVGSVVYHPPGASDSRLFSPEWASLRMLAVSPRHRGQGIGQQLSLECIHRAKQDKAEVVGLHTSELMAAARQIYEKLGFKQEIDLPRHFGIQYWRYVLKLAESLPAR